MSEENVDKVRKGIEEFNRREFDAALAKFADDVTWESFLSRTETQVLRGKEQIRAAWESQVEALDLRSEPDEFIAVGSDKVVVPMQLAASARGSEMSLVAWVTWVWTFAGGLVRRVEWFDTREEALEAAGLRE